MKYNIGDSFYQYDKYGFLIERKIVGFKYIIENNTDGKTTSFTEEQIDNYLEEGKFSREAISKEDFEIAALEKKYGIKLTKEK